MEKIELFNQMYTVEALVLTRVPQNSVCEDFFSCDIWEIRTRTYNARIKQRVSPTVFLAFNHETCFCKLTFMFRELLADTY